MNSFRVYLGLFIFAFFASRTFADPTPPSPADPSHVKLPGFGISFAAPDGWDRRPEVYYSQLARFSLIKDKKILGLLVVETAAEGRSAKDVASQLAAGGGGDVVAGHPLGGTGGQTIEVKLAPTADFPSMIAGVMPVRDQVGVFTVGQQDANAALTALRAVIASVVVSKQTPASDDLTLRKRPIPLFNSAVLILLPEPFRPDKVKKPEAEAFFGARDWPSGRDEASIHMQVVANPRRADIGIIGAAMAKSLTAKFKPSEPITMSKVNDKPLAYVSTTFAAKAGEAERIMYMVLDDSRFAVLIFRTTASDDAAREKYMAMVEQIGKTARFSSAYQEGVRSATAPAGKQ
jgi:hypothetical protein